MKKALDKLLGFVFLAISGFRKKSAREKARIEFESMPTDGREAFIVFKKEKKS